MHGQVTVDGRTLNSSDRYGDWKVLDWDGWTDSPERKLKSESRPLADGDYDADEFFDIREINITGRLKAKSHDMAHEAENWLKAMILNGSGTMLVRGHGPDQSAKVKLAGAIKCKIEPGTDNYLRWQIRIKANDPYKYGETHPFAVASGNEVFVFQRGMVPAWPKLTITGNLPGGYEVGLVDRLIQVTKPLTAGQTHTIDTRSGILRSNGLVVAGGLGITELFRVKPGLPQSLLFMPRTTGSGTLKAEVTDTYI